VGDVIGAVKYDPEAKKEEDAVNAQKRSGLMKWLYRFKLFRYLVRPHKAKSASYPTTVAKSEETNIEKIFDAYKTQRPDEEYYVTCKVEGSAGAWMLCGKRRKYRVFSHNVIRSTKDNNAWAEISRKYSIEKILRNEKRNLCIQGEVCGPGIQQNIYGFIDFRLFVYKITDTDTGEAFNYQDLVAFCKNYGLEMVPVVYVNKLLLGTLDNMLKDCEGKSVLADVPREGLVWRSMINQNIGFKCKSRSYQLWFVGNKETV
jgi:hypothetical protein